MSETPPDERPEDVLAAWFRRRNDSLLPAPGLFTFGDPAGNASSLREWLAAHGYALSKSAPDRPVLDVGRLVRIEAAARALVARVQANPRLPEDRDLRAALSEPASAEPDRWREALARPSFRAALEAGLADLEAGRTERAEPALREEIARLERALQRCEEAPFA